MVVGDIIQIQNTSAASGVGCNVATANIFRNSNPIAVATDTQTGYGVGATATWTVTAATTIVELYAGPQAV